ncbi:WD40 repeat domain-containing protein [Streptomyces sp. enrichment culture]|uniref:WD40 repeat domain-containing protein n=1 Tax=Streptomyces sp. enrichment culture TaxID=1795815 RepID=UPI003F546D4C
MTDLVHEGGTGGEPAATWVVGPGTGWRVEWATDGLITGSGKAATGHADWVRSAATTVVDGRAVAITGADDEAVLVWDLATGERIGAALPARGSVWTVATEIVDGRPVALVADPSALVQSWDLAEGRPLASLAGGAWAAATGVVNGRPMVLVGRQNVPRLSMWDPATGEVVGDLVSDPPVGRIGAVVAVTTAVVDGHSEAVTLHDDSTVRAWNLTERLYQGQVAPPTGGNSQRVSLAVAVVSGRLVAVTGTWDGQVQVWDVATCTEVTGRAPLTGHTGPVWALATTVIDRRPLVITAGDDRTVRVWDMAARRQVGSDLVFPSEVTAVTMASDGRLVVGVGGDIAVLAPHPHAWARVDGDAVPLVVGQSDEHRFAAMSSIAAPLIDQN